MATRRLRAEDWAPFQPTRISTTKAVREPRDERPRLPKSIQRARPSPINMAPGVPLPLFATSTTNTYQPNDKARQLPRDPEIVDLALPNTWPRRGISLHQLSINRMYSPSVYSTAPSEMSYGILDYYMKDHSTSPSPAPPVANAPRIDTPVLDPAMTDFDFNLLPVKIPKTPARNHALGEQDLADATAGAKQFSALPSKTPQPLTTLPPTPPPSIELQRPPTQYSLFPTIKDPLVIISNSTSTPPQRTSDHLTTPPPSYRPRKECFSLPSSSPGTRSRKDSCTSSSTSTKRSLAPRIFSASSSSDKKNENKPPTPPLSSSSPTENRTRWSAAAMASPTPLTARQRTSSSPLLPSDGPRRVGTGSSSGSPGYPACFFDDDDDDDSLDGDAGDLHSQGRDDGTLPLRRRLWGRRGSLTAGQRRGAESKRGAGKGRGLEGRWRSWVLCGGGR